MVGAGWVTRSGREQGQTVEGLVIIVGALTQSWCEVNMDQSQGLWGSLAPRETQVAKQLMGAKVPGSAFQESSVLSVLDAPGVPLVSAGVWNSETAHPHI